MFMNTRFYKIIAIIPLVLILFLLTALGLQPPTISAATNCSTQTDIPQIECEALVDLYNSTDGSNWSDSPGNGWNQNNAPCSWTGVTCWLSHIALINRNSKGLSGTIPSTLENLSNLRLQTLSLFDNQLTGTIPPELGNLSNLENLTLHRNQLTGTIPSELGNLSDLRGLSLSDNQLTGTIPPELGNLSSLQSLYLYDNQLTGNIPPELGNLSNAGDIGLGINQLTGTIPPELGNLSNLQHLYLYHNQLTGTIPSELGNLSNLQSLYLYDNQLTGTIPSELGNLSNLKQLLLSRNRLAGSIPPELGNLSSLQYLHFASNQLTGNIPISFTQLITVTSLNIRFNGLSSPNGSVTDFVNDKDSYWASTQTVPPKVNNATPVSASTIQINWQPISYTQDGGYYQVYYSLVAGGPYTKAISTTSDKIASSYTISGLTPNTTYYFVVATHTPAHTNNSNAITSTHSNEVSATSLTNQIPVADSGSDQSVTIGYIVQLDGSNSSDSDGDMPLTYNWIQTGGTPTIGLSSRDAVLPTFTAAYTGVFTFSLTVTDSVGSVSAPDEVVVRVISGQKVYLPLVIKE